MRTVMGVSGLISANALGFTLPHEHLFTDLSFYCDSRVFERDMEQYSQQISRKIKENVAKRPWVYKDNLVLDDEDSAKEEAKSFRMVGGETIVDLSPCQAMGRNPIALKKVSLAAGINVIMSCGRYTEPSMSAVEKGLSVEALESRFLDEFTNGVDNTGIRPGILKVAFVDRLDKDPELRSLRAAGRVQRKIGCALSIHPHIWQQDSHQLLDVLEQEKCDLRKVILCHQDYLGNQMEYLNSLLKRGCYIEFDTFGSGWIDDPMWRTNEKQKVVNVVNQVKAGNARQLLISGDMCLKIMLAKWGGIGLKNIPLNTIPALLANGISPENIGMLFVENPKRVLCY